MKIFLIAWLSVGTLSGLLLREMFKKTDEVVASAIRTFYILFTLGGFVSALLLLCGVAHRIYLRLKGR